MKSSEPRDNVCRLYCLVHYEPDQHKVLSYVSAVSGLHVHQEYNEEVPGVRPEVQSPDEERFVVWELRLSKALCSRRVRVVWSGV